MNCGHVYHLSCIRRWFECKSKNPRSGNPRNQSPPHAPCPKCKEPFDMGSTVTIYLDLMAKETPGKGGVGGRGRRGPAGAMASLASPSNIKKGKKHKSGLVNLVSSDDEDDDVVPESPDEVRGTRGNWQRSASTSQEINETINSLSAELNQATRRAREAEDQLAAAEMRHEAEVAEDLHLNQRVELLTQELGVAKNTLKESQFVERMAKEKLKSVTDTLNERTAECSRLRTKVTSFETQKKLERDLSDVHGRVTGESDLLKRFGNGSGVEQRAAVETLCRALAGKNRQLHSSLEEYGKLTQKFKQSDKKLRVAETKLGELSKAGPSVPSDDGTPQEFDTCRGTKRVRETPLDSGRLDAHTGGTGRGRRGWDSESQETETANTFPKANPFGKATKRVPAVHHIGGPLSRVPTSIGKKSKASKSGEDLLDDILQGVDANENVPSRLKTGTRKNTTSTQKPGSFVGRGLGDENTADGGSFIIHGPDGRGGRVKIVKPGGLGGMDKQSARITSRNTKSAVDANGALDRFLSRG